MFKKYSYLIILFVTFSCASNFNYYEKVGFAKVSKSKARLVKPDGEVSDVYLVLNNYDKILNWNRSLRFAITVGLFADYLSDV